MANNNCSLKIINAGALHRVIGNCIELFLSKNPRITLEMEVVGSREGAKRSLAGDKYDIVALADQALFVELIVPEQDVNCSVFYDTRLIGIQS